MSTPYADTDNQSHESTSSPLLAVLRAPAYLLLWTAQFAALLAGFFNYVAIAWLALQLTGSSLVVGSLLAAAAIPMAVLMLVGGAISDRFSPRSTMLAAGLARGAVMAVIAALALAHSVQVWNLYVAAVLVGATTAFFTPASSALLPRLVRDEQLEAGNALFNISATAATILGPAAAGLLVAAVGAGSALAGDAGASIVSGLLPAFLPAAAREAGRRQGPGALAAIAEGLRHVWADASLRATILVLAALNFFLIGAIEVGLPLLARQRFSQGAFALGTAFAAWGLGSTAGSIVAATRPKPKHMAAVLVAVVAVLGAGMAGAFLAPDLPVLVAVMVVVGLFEGVGTTYLISWMQRRTEMAMQGRVMALGRLAMVGLEPLSLALAGALAASHLGVLFWGAAGAVLLTAALAAASPAVRRM
ncbi:MAG TPA: MFS transporter [Candidatus Dormibacteraeota bacterium]